MIRLPPATLRIASDLTTADRGRRAAGRLGDSLGSRVLRTSGGPVDPIAIARMESIEVVNASSIQESGRIEWAGDGLRVVVRATDSPRRQRFTVAHELAHHLLFGVEKNRSRTHSEEEETRCDRFAAGLLMPKAEFVNLYDDLRKLARPSAVCELMDRFDVSLLSAMRRLGDLALVDSASLLLLLGRGARDEYRVVSATYDRSVYRRIEGMTTRQLGLNEALARAMSMRPGSRRVPVSAQLPTKGRGGTATSRSILPAVMTCVPFGDPTDRAQHQVLVDIDPAVDPLRPRFRKPAAPLQADLISGR